jgi:hypothetical protein
MLREQLGLYLSEGAALEAVEPCRRDLEAYFLDVVGNENACS